MIIINDIEIPNKVYNNYINDTINKIFKILPIYEDCVAQVTEVEKENHYKNYISYLDKLIIMFTGSEILFDKRDFLSLLSIIKGLEAKTDLPKDQVKSLVFHCISILDKMKV